MTVVVVVAFVCCVCVCDAIVMMLLAVGIKAVRHVHLCNGKLDAELGA